MKKLTKVIRLHKEGCDEKNKKKPIWEYRIYFTVIFIFSLPGALLTCMKSLIKGKIEKDMFE